MGKDKLIKKNESRQGPPVVEDNSSAGADALRNPGLERKCLIAAGVILAVMIGIVLWNCGNHVIWQDDQYTDMNVLMAGENFATQGFFKLHFLPVQCVGPVGDAPKYYTHYPAVPELFNGVLRVCGVRSLTGMRLINGLLMIMGLGAMCAGLWRVAGPLAAVCGLAVAGTSGFFFNYSMSLHHTISIFLLGLFVMFFLRAMESETFCKKARIGAWVAIFLASLTSFEFILLPQAFAWVYVLATGKLRKEWKTLVFLGTAPLLGVGLHFMQNVWALGWNDAVEDAADAFIRPGRGGVQDRWDALAGVPAFLTREGARNFFWPWMSLPVFAVVCMAVRSPKQTQADSSARAATAVLLAALVGGATWYLFMPVHTLKHPHTMAQLVLPVFVVMGSLIAICLERLWRPGASWPERVFILALLITAAYGQHYGVRVSEERTHQYRDFFPVYEAVGSDSLPEKCGVLTNTFADAQLAYFTRRPMWRFPTEDLSSMVYSSPQALAESIRALQVRLPADWPIRYYLMDLRFPAGPRNEVFAILAQTCVGEAIGMPMPDGRMRPVLVKFDLSPLFLPASLRAPLTQEVIECQMRGQFKPWRISNYDVRYVAAVKAQKIAQQGR